MTAEVAEVAEIAEVAEVAEVAAPDVRALVHALVAALDPAAEIELRRVLCRDAYRRGFAAGRMSGYRQANAERDRAWNAIARPVARGGPSFVEVETRRWGPEGRASFGAPRFGDNSPRKASAA